MRGPPQRRRQTGGAGTAGGEAIQSFERLVAVSRKRAFENPAITALRGDLCKAYLELAHLPAGTRERTSRPTVCSATAREVLENIPRETPDQLFELATVYAALVPPANAELEPNETDAAEHKRYADLAVETLKKAIIAGYLNATTLKTSRLLDPLRERDDFQDIVATVAKSAEAQELASRNEDSTSQKLADRRQAPNILKAM